ncbi:MAG: response regulator [Alphaproteobacteria bacterium]|nr:response regulator [Alphaproteobacteria bacterium]
MTSADFLAKILIIDDDSGLRETLGDFLTQEGYETLEAANIADARAHIAAGIPDLLLLDLSMPGGDGLSFAAEIRATSATPIIIISGKGQIIDRVVGLEVGADDYLAKPFELRELLARIRAVLRRSASAAAGLAQPGAPTVAVRTARFGGVFVLRPERRQLETSRGDAVDLTGAEYGLLAAFVDRPNRVLTRDAIADLVQRSDADTFDRSIDALVSRLRRKLAPYADAMQLVRTVRGEGYVLASDVSWSNS